MDSHLRLFGYKKTWILFELELYRPLCISYSLKRLLLYFDVCLHVQKMARNVGM